MRQSNLNFLHGQFGDNLFPEVSEKVIFHQKGRERVGLLSKNKDVLRGGRGGGILVSLGCHNKILQAK